MCDPVFWSWCRGKARHSPQTSPNGNKLLLYSKRLRIYLLICVSGISNLIKCLSDQNTRKTGMNLHQLRFVREAVRQNYNLTDAAKALFTSQPGVSKAIIELEEELGVDIFTRHGKRIRGLTEPGRLVLESVELIMQEIDSLKRIGKEFAAHDSGSFTIATTHTQARYMLPKVVQGFMAKFPKVRLSLLQGNPRQIAEMVKNDQADLAIATE